MSLRQMGYSPLHGGLTPPEDSRARGPQIVGAQSERAAAGTGAQVPAAGREWGEHTPPRAHSLFLVLWEFAGDRKPSQPHGVIKAFAVERKTHRSCLYTLLSFLPPSILPFSNHSSSIHFLYSINKHTSGLVSYSAREWKTRQGGSLPLCQGDNQWITQTA